MEMCRSTLSRHHHQRVSRAHVPHSTRTSLRIQLNGHPLMWSCEPALVPTPTCPPTTLPHSPPRERDLVPRLPPQPAAAFCHFQLSSKWATVTYVPIPSSLRLRPRSCHPLLDLSTTRRSAVDSRRARGVCGASLCSRSCLKGGDVASRSGDRPWKDMDGTSEGGRRDAVGRLTRGQGEQPLI